jgi:DNA-binding MarR family transcriptional regulator
MLPNANDINISQINFPESFLQSAVFSPEFFSKYKENLEKDPEEAENVRFYRTQAAEKIYRNRRMRDSLFTTNFGVSLFSDPAWDILLDIYINTNKNIGISVSNACLSSSAPNTTALRYITDMVNRGVIERTAHPNDRRVFLINLSAKAVKIMDIIIDQINESPNAQ